MLDVGLQHHAAQYLHEVLGEEAVHVRVGKPPADLPYLVQDTYEIVPVEILGLEAAMAALKGSNALPAGEMARHVRKIQEQLHRPVIVALPQVSASERKKLIENGLAFVVPGQQLYAPWLGVVLSERFPANPRRQQVLMSPTTQALLIWYLLHYPVGELWQPSADAVALQYTTMTASRAVRELLQFDFFGLEVRGRTRLLEVKTTHHQLWNKALLHLATPVQRTLWTYDPRIPQMQDVQLAGESALARHTMLNAPSTPVVAVTSDIVAQAKLSGVQFEHRQMGDAIEVQVWRYRPTMEAKSETADRLSVWLSLKDKQDPRIEIALDELEKTFPW